MRQLLLIAGIAFIFIFGYLIMKKLDFALTENHRKQALPQSPHRQHLRIGFSDSLTARNISEYLKKYPDFSINLSSGTDEDLTRQLFAHQLDIIFLSDGTENFLNVENGQKKNFDN